MIAALILAGGRATRLGGGDKGLRPIAGRTVLARVLERIGPQVSRLAINANGDPARFADTALPIIADDLPDHPGPLAGVLAGLDWVAAHSAETSWLLSVPADAPFLPLDLAARLLAERGGARLACAASGGRVHPVIALWPVTIRHALRQALLSGVRKVGAFTAGAAIVAWPIEPYDPFFNVNTPDDLTEAERIALTL